MKILLFDIDGTLIDAGSAPQKAFNRAFHERFGIQKALDGVDIHGVTDPIIAQNVAQAKLNRGFEWLEYQEFQKKYFEYLKLELEQEKNYKVLPGIEELCQELNNREDCVLGLQTGNLTEAASIKLEPGNLNRYFTFGGFASDNEDRIKIVDIAIARAKYQLGIDDIINKNIFVIGDTPQDMNAGCKNNVNAIGVATGVYSEEKLKESGASITFSDLSNINPFLDFVFGGK